MTQVLIILMKTNASGIFYIIENYSYQMYIWDKQQYKHICAIIYIMSNSNFRTKNAPLHRIIMLKIV
ncbi:hypothetical protein DFQ02_102241 [Seonamhaeicola aphaedonensis]|uniref:Uncharacterized protein n=1 Tax=Seonamhaeicola aphaedonensis TaxID=1461338 RepID=A0A3D9HIZ4_9FLAO|nr:hypothetical protein DFQ02_102241 [Seonamhaeicola aphaedonensis]